MLARGSAPGYRASHRACVAIDPRAHDEGARRGAIDASSLTRDGVEAQRHAVKRSRRARRNRWGAGRQADLATSDVTPH